jgi:hypothetical protein
MISWALTRLEGDEKVMHGNLMGRTRLTNPGMTRDSVSLTGSGL